MISSLIHVNKARQCRAFLLGLLFAVQFISTDILQEISITKLFEFDTET
jgi:hypothetical protein